MLLLQLLKALQTVTRIVPTEAVFMLDFLKRKEKSKKRGRDSSLPNMEYYKLILFIVINENSTYYYLQAHQMALIRKRLAVEMWIYEQLNELHGCTVSYIFRCHKYIGVVGGNALRF